MNGHLHIRGLDIAVDDALLMSVLDGFANLQEQTKSLFNGKFLKVTVFGDWDAFDIFHYKVWSADLGGSSIKHMRNVGVFQQGQSLPFGLKASNYLLGIHARLDDFQRDPAFDWSLLFGKVNYTAATFSQYAEEFVSTNLTAWSNYSSTEIHCGDRFLLLRAIIIFLVCIVHRHSSLQMFFGIH
jgi:hypothetical protein